MTSARGLLLSAMLGIGAIACASTQVQTPQPTSSSPAEAPATERLVGPLSQADSAALATMVDRVNTYRALRDRLEGDLPALPVNAAPAQIDSHQRALEARIREARAGARPGNLLTDQAQPVIRRLLLAVFDGPDGRQLRSSILDVSPTGVKAVVNQRYPDSAPVATMPPQVLQTLPRLGEGLEYRFLGRDLILLDVRARLIVDVMDDVLRR